MQVMIRWGVLVGKVEALGVSRQSKMKWNTLDTDDQDRIVRMAWEDRTSFEAIQKQFGLTPNEVVKFMRTQLSERDYRRWRRRANQQGHLKHESQQPKGLSRFKCSRQRLDGSTKGWK